MSANVIIIIYYKHFFTDFLIKKHHFVTIAAKIVPIRNKFSLFLYF